MDVELEWGEGISINVSMPDEMPYEEFLDRVEEVEFLIKRWDTHRQEELKEELERLKQERHEEIERMSAEERKLFEEFLQWKKQRGSEPSRSSVMPPSPYKQPATPKVSAAEPAAPKPPSPPVQVTPQKTSSAPYNPKVASAVESRLAELEEHSNRMMQALGSLSSD